MINFNSKFNPKASNMGFFISNDLKFKQNKSVPEAITSKINSFLKRVSKNNKKEILSFDISESQKCFLIIINTKIIKGSGIKSFDDSALTAIARVESFEGLQMPSNLFEKHFRQFILVFNPNK